jgi:hypothetical protein
MRPGIAGRKRDKRPASGGKRAKTMQFAVGKGKSSRGFFGVILNMSDLHPIEMPRAMQHTFDHDQTRRLLA